MHSQRVDAILNDIASNPKNPTGAEMARAKATAKDSYLATCILMNSDRKRFGGLIRDIENEHTRGTNSYPTTLTEAYDYLVNYKGSRLSSNDADEGGLSLYNDGDNDNGGRGGHGGHGGRNGGRGGHGGGARGDAARGGGCGGGARGDAARGIGRNGGGRGRGRGGRGRGDTGEGAEGDDAQFLLEAVGNNLEEVDEYLCFQQSHSRPSLKNALLLDSCSSINLVCSKELLHDITTVNKTMHVRCNAGVKSTNRQGFLGNFPEAVCPILMARPIFCHSILSRTITECSMTVLAKMLLS
jgi:hypothetical protein